jgi:hypothetical protein
MQETEMRKQLVECALLTTVALQRWAQHPAGAALSQLHLHLSNLPAVYCRATLALKKKQKYLISNERRKERNEKIDTGHERCRRHRLGHGMPTNQGHF